MRRFRSLLTGLMLLCVGSALCACDPSQADPAFRPDANGSTLAGASLATTGTPWGILAGMLVNVVASVFIGKSTAKAAVVKEAGTDYSQDEIHAMADGLRKAGYTLSRTP